MNRPSTELIEENKKPEEVKDYTGRMFINNNDSASLHKVIKQDNSYVVTKKDSLPLDSKVTTYYRIIFFEQCLTNGYFEIITEEKASYTGVSFYDPNFKEVIFWSQSLCGGACFKSPQQTGVQYSDI